MWTTSGPRQIWTGPVDALHPPDPLNFLSAEELYRVLGHQELSAELGYTIR